MARPLVNGNHPSATRASETEEGAPTPRPRGIPAALANAEARDTYVSNHDVPMCDMHATASEEGEAVLFALPRRSFARDCGRERRKRQVRRAA
eukprot:13704224-Alexandrium_andersonii.AAC.1